MDPLEFRKDFPEFTDVACFPSQQIEFWSGMGEKLISQDRFGTLYTEAVELFTAHNIVLSAQSRAATVTGGMPGGNAGAIAGKSVGSVNVSYDTSGAMELNAGHWNQTTYGRQYIHLVRMIGQGCYQL